jgi:hypothetical protein
MKYVLRTLLVISFLMVLMPTRLLAQQPIAARWTIG